MLILNYAACSGGSKCTKAQHVIRTSSTNGSSNIVMPVDKILNHLTLAMAFSTKILTLATLLVTATSSELIWLPLAALGGIAK